MEEEEFMFVKNGLSLKLFRSGALIRMKKEKLLIESMLMDHTRRGIADGPLKDNKKKISEIVKPQN